MAQAHIPSNLHYLAARNLTPTVSFFVAVAVLVSKWQERRRTRIELKTLDDHLLNDIGLTRHQAEYEASLPFWRI